jgi:hypothetical protein
MEKTITAAVFSVLATGAADVDRGDHGSPIPPPGESGWLGAPVQHPGERGNLQNLLLNALGTRQPGPGQLRIPIPADDATYEVIIEKPGLPRLVPAAKRDRD